MPKPPDTSAASGASSASRAANRIRPRRALVSVFDKEGVLELCRVLAEFDVEILSSGGTATLLADNGVSVTAVADYTGFPEMLDGRVKTLHPRIHAGILAVRDNPEHMRDLERHEIGTIDLVVVNLYPFEKTAATGGLAEEEVVEMIDVGGPTMVRAAAKNFKDVAVVVDGRDYGLVATELREHGGLSLETRRALAVKAFQRTSRYDAAVQAWLDRNGDATMPSAADDPFPDNLRLDFTKAQALRYGENPHQRAAFYRDPLCSGPFVCEATQLQGKELSFNNILDFDAALALAAEFAAPACVIVKHGNPCGVAVAGDPREAFTKALECDPASAFGGVIAVNRKLDRRAAEAIAEIFVEGIIGPDFDAEARAALRKKKSLRLLQTGSLSGYRQKGWDLRRVRGGLLAQDWDAGIENVRECRVVTERRPTDEEWQALQFAWTVAKHVKSNAIVFARADRTLGIGAGQMSRVDAARLAVQKAAGSLAGAAVASDAFFPFRDALDVPAEAGIAAVVQPGGSVRDDEVIQAANEHGMAMVFTGRRHFRH